jgi:hypothetical protein
MAKHQKKKLGLQKDVPSIFKGVPIPSKKGGDNAQQPNQTPAAKGKRNIPALQHTYYFPEIERSSNISKPEHKDKILESQNKEKTPPKSGSGHPPRETFKESQVSLIKKINQPTQLLRKDTPVKQLVFDTNKKVNGPSLRQRIKDKLSASKPVTGSARQKATAAMIPILALVFIFVLRQVFGAPPSKTEGSVKNDTPEIVTATGSSNEIDWKIPSPFPIAIRDPIKMNSSYNEQNEAVEPEKIEELDINGILYSKDNPSVLIGSHIAHEGEKISGVTIVKINQNSVEFEINGKKWERKVQTRPGNTK